MQFLLVSSFFKKIICAAAGLRAIAIVVVVVDIVPFQRIVSVAGCSIDIVVTTSMISLAPICTYFGVARVIAVPRMEAGSGMRGAPRLRDAWLHNACEKVGGEAGLAAHRLSSLVAMALIRGAAVQAHKLGGVKVKVVAAFCICFTVA